MAHAGKPPSVMLRALPNRKVDTRRPDGSMVCMRVNHDARRIGPLRVIAACMFLAFLVSMIVFSLSH